jgi:hypothetical protein
MNNEMQAAIEVVMENFQKEMSNLEGVNVGSAFKTKEEIIVWVSKTVIDVRDFVIYGLSLIEFVNNGGTFDQFIDNQLEFISQFDKPGYDKKSKEHWVNLLYKLYPEVSEKIDSIK